MPCNSRTSAVFVTLVSLTAALVFSVASAQSWQDAISVEDGFATVFPGTPTVRDIEWDSEYGAVFPGRVYSLDVDDRYYAVTIIDYRDAQAIHLARTNYTEADSPQRYNYWRVDIVASVAYAAAQFRQRGGEVTFDAWHHIDRVPGHQIQLTNTDGSRTYAGIYLHENRLYIIEATVPANTPPQGMFQQGLRFIDEQGRRIRYQWDDNNQLIKQTRETVTRE